MCNSHSRPLQTSCFACACYTAHELGHVQKVRGAAQQSPWRNHLKLKFSLALLSLLTLGTPIYAQIIDHSPCVQCLATARAELTKCLDAAISQEDKKSCQEKRETQAQTCENECTIEKAAEGAFPSTSSLGRGGTDQVCIREHRTQQIMCGKLIH